MEKAFEPYVDGSTNTVIKVVGVGGAGGNALNTMVTKLTDCQAVSYTHLTLPTILLV